MRYRARAPHGTDLPAGLEHFAAEHTPGSLAQLFGAAPDSGLHLLERRSSCGENGARTGVQPLCCCTRSKECLAGVMGGSHTRPLLVVDAVEDHFLVILDVVAQPLLTEAAGHLLAD